MVKIRLARAGAKKSAYYRIVAIDSRKKRDGAVLEQVGSYDPMKQPAEVKLDEQRLDYWVRNGAQLSETVASLVKKTRAAQPTG